MESAINEIVSAIGCISTLQEDDRGGRGGKERAGSRSGGYFSSCTNASGRFSANDYELPLVFEETPYAVPINGYVSPVIVLLTVVANAFVCVVLLQEKMRSPTNLLLLGMAVSDTLTGVFALPSFIYFYSLGHHSDFVPYEWCYVDMALTNLPTVSHTSSIWLTVALAAQRYVLAYHPERAKSLVTIPRTIRVIVVIYIVAFISHSTRFFEHRFDATETELESVLDQGRTFVGCYKRKIAAFDSDVYHQTYWWLRIILAHFVPCASLVLLNALLCYAMRLAQERGRVLFRQNKSIESRRLAETNMATLMLIVVVGMFLLVEVPLAVLLITMIVENSFGLVVMEMVNRRIAAIFINFFILLSYPFNFLIYCAMSRQFRTSFTQLFFCRQRNLQESTDL